MVQKPTSAQIDNSPDALGAPDASTQLTRTIYRCDHCNEFRGAFKSVAAHELECSSNAQRSSARCDTSSSSSDSSLDCDGQSSKKKKSKEQRRGCKKYVASAHATKPVLLRPDIAEAVRIHKESENLSPEHQAQKQAAAAARASAMQQNTEARRRRNQQQAEQNATEAARANADEAVARILARERAAEVTRLKANAEAVERSQLAAESAAAHVARAKAEEEEAETAKRANSLSFTERRRFWKSELDNVKQFEEAKQLEAVEAVRKRPHSGSG